MNSLELRIPPVALVFITGACMWLVAQLAPSTSLALPWRIALATVLACAGAIVALAGVTAFRRARTTVNPTTPDATSAIVASGIYRRSRNPMYLGFVLMLAGWSAFLASPMAMLLLPVFIAYMNRFQIVPEERVLSAKFGAQYSDYMRQARRWI